MPSGRAQWIAVAKAIYSRFGEVQLTDRAAAMTYYSILSVFPALLVVVSLLTLLGTYPDTYQSIVDTLRDAAPGPAVDAIDSALRNSLSSRGDAGAVLAVGLLLAFYSASGATGAAMRGLESINRAKRGRDFLPNLGVRIGLTALLAVLVLIAFLAVVVAGPLFGSIADAAGFSGVVSTLVGYMRWPIGAAALLAAFAIVYALGPRRTPRPGDRSLVSVLPGAIVGTALWFAVSLLFTAYVSHFGSYDKTYGTLGALISLLIWLWLGNLAFLIGALFNAEKERVRGDA
ncbi:MAG TPA: YihY/virulence factor BrkB family protein [Solirubrobacterales bacterium]|nr:YihY/virulence factor BrkB family protein [Solirubrobacterales bacterium]